MRIAHNIFWEVVFVLASVLIFRSAWMLLDTIPVFQESAVLVLSLIAGIVLSSIALHRLYILK